MEHTIQDTSRLSTVRNWAFEENPERCEQWPNRYSICGSIPARKGPSIATAGNVRITVIADQRRSIVE